MDCFYQPNRGSNGGKWLDSEKQRYEELMGNVFPGEEDLLKDDFDAYFCLLPSNVKVLFTNELHVKSRLGSGN